MILPFSTKLNGKETYFVEKIFKGIKKCLNDNSYFNLGREFNEYEYLIPYQIDVDIFKDIKPKLHTIRDDKNERWQVGTMIDFFINVRQKNMFRFAPRLPVVSTQVVEIIHTEYMNDIIITIDKKRLNIFEMQQFAYNDGFDNLYEFIVYFDIDCVRKLIHWTDLRY